MSSTEVAIDDHFTARMVRTDALGAGKPRPVNPFANRSAHTSSSVQSERELAPEVSALAKVGAVYEQPGVFGSIQKVVDTKEEQYIILDERIKTHPKSGKQLHTTDKLPTDGTREK